MLCDALQARTVLTHALQNNYAILAINADSPAAVYDCLEAARSIDAPVIIEASLWQLKGRSFGSGNAVLGLSQYISTLAVLANSERFKNIPIIFHTDHIKGPETIEILTAAIKGISLEHHQQSISLRASTVSLDASDFTAEENINHMLQLCTIARDSSLPVTLEMESAVDEGVTTEEETKNLLGSIEEKFPGHIFLWAPGVGTKHGFGDSMNFNVETIAKHHRLTQQLTGRKIGIALHGSTGMSHQDLSDAATAGVIKVNWSTESLFIRSEASREYYALMHQQLQKKHPDWKATAMDNGVNSYISKIYIPKVVERMRILGGEGKAKGCDLLLQF